MCAGFSGLKEMFVYCEIVIFVYFYFLGLIVSVIGLIVSVINFFEVL